MSKTRTSLYVAEETHELVSEMAAESRDRDEMPNLSQSQIYRRLIQSGIQESEGLLDMVPEERRILHQREQHIGGEARLSSLRVGFEARVRQHLKRRFEAGIRPDQIDVFAAGLKEDARILWPDDEERREQAIGYVDDAAEEMREAIEATDYDPLDPDEIFGGYSTVESAAAETAAVEMSDDRREEIAAAIRDRLDGPERSPEAVIRAVARTYGIDPETVDRIAREDVQTDPEPPTGSPQ